jgi:hypothetical protein
MPSYRHFTPPPWNEEASFRETTLICIDDPETRAPFRTVGRVLYELAVETTRKMGGESSSTRAELRAIAADLRYTSGFCAMVGRSVEERPLDGEDAVLARFAGQLARRVGALAASIEERLS